MTGHARWIGCAAPDGCDGDHWAKGYCRRHYTRMLRNGTTVIAAPLPKKDERGPRKLRPGQRIDDAISNPANGTITLEEWHRLRDNPAADIHIVMHSHHATGIPS